MPVFRRFFDVIWQLTLEKALFYALSMTNNLCVCGFHCLFVFLGSHRRVFVRYVARIRAFFSGEHGMAFSERMVCFSECRCFFPVYGNVIGTFFGWHIIALVVLFINNAAHGSTRVCPSPSAIVLRCRLGVDAEPRKAATLWRGFPLNVKLHFADTVRIRR